MPKINRDVIDKSRKIFSTRVEEKLIKRVKIFAIEKGVTVQNLLENALTEYVDKHEGK